MLVEAALPMGRDLIEQVGYYRYTSLSYAVKGKFPSTGHIFAEIFENIERRKVTGEVANVLLLGQPIK